jgi:beta-galactosidase
MASSTIAAPSRNLFHELLGKSDAETTARIESIWRDFTKGDAETQRLYFTAPDDAAYIADVGNQDVRSEGMSYGMMIAVQLDRRDEFDRLWKWAYTHMRHKSGPRAGYFDWQRKYDGSAISGGASASDGEVWIVTALFFAAHRWGDGTGIYAYSRQAQGLLREMLHKESTPDGMSSAIFDRTQRQVTFCPIGQAATITDPSYHQPAFYELWSRWAESSEDRQFWAEAARTSRAFWRRNAHPLTGLMSEYAHFDGRAYTGGGFGPGRDEFSFDAWRTLASVALDHSWGSGDAWAVERTDRVLRFLGSKEEHLVSCYTLDGAPIGNDQSPGLIAMAAAAGIAASDPEIARPFVQRLWDSPTPTGRWRYYHGMLTMLGFLQAGGRFQFFEPPPPLLTRTGAAPSGHEGEVYFSAFSYKGRAERETAALKPGQYRNPVLAGFFPDPSICRAGDDYYLVNSTFAYYPGLPIFHSRDLVNWQLVGHAIDRPGQLDYRGLGVSRGLFAPAISFHNGVFYIVCTQIDGGGNFLITAQNPAGPWSDPVWLDFDGIDPSLFFDADGRAWLVHNGGPPDDRPLYEGHRAVWLREFDPVKLKASRSARLLVNGGTDINRKPIWIEGPHLYHRGEWFYLTCAEGGTGENHSQVILRSRTIDGPYVSWAGNPILTQRDLASGAIGAVTCTGHADLEIGPDGCWWAVFLGCRPYAEGRYFTTGRETFLLPVTWTSDGWPMILPAGSRVPLVASASVPQTQQSPNVGVTGTWRAAFDRPVLDPFWLMLRAPVEPWWRIDSRSSALLITPRPATLAGKDNPSFLARRVQHARFTTETTLEVPEDSRVSAGLAFFQSEKHHYYFSVRRAWRGPVVALELADGNLPVQLADATIPVAAREVSLRIEAEDAVTRFFYSAGGGKWCPLGDRFDTRPVTVAAAGQGMHFTGAVVGMHARLEPAASRERTLFNACWRFKTQDAEDCAGRLRYDARPVPRDENDDRPADAMPTEAELVSGSGLEVLKPWILPTANPFISDPAKWAARPAAEPSISPAYTRLDFDDGDWRKLDLPHDWAIEGPFNQTGPGGGMGRLPSAQVGWYRKSFHLPAEDAGRVVRLEIDGAMSYAMVWCNGRLVGGWPYGYASWGLDLTSYLVPGGDNQLAIRLDNPPYSSRWYPGGGLYRNVWLTKCSPVHVGTWGTFVSTRDVSELAAKVDLSVTVQNQGTEAAEVGITTSLYSLDPDGRCSDSEVAAFAPTCLTILPGSAKTSSTSLELAHPRLWGPPPSQSPQRYLAITILKQSGREVDRYETRFGIRALSFDPQTGLHVNGEPIRIQGVNQHHDLGALGAAFNVRAARRQLEALREMGCNAVRMAHNPPAPELLDLTDELGFLVVDELYDCWERKKTPLDFHLIFPDWAEADLRALIRRDRNHPSVILWSTGNEVGEQYTGADGAEVARRLRDIARTEDPTRPTTTAMNWAKPEMALPAVSEVVSLNYQGEGIRDTPAHDGIGGIRTAPQYAAFHAKFPRKMIVASETAAALSTRGEYLFPVSTAPSSPVRDDMGGDSARGFVSAYELHAADFGSTPDKVFGVQDRHPFVAGEFVWSGWDYLGEPTPYYSSRSSGFGIIDLAGFPKDRFYLYQSRWRPELPMVHILPHWTWPERVGLVTPVHVFTSGDEAELFLNGRSLGRKRKGVFEYRLRWDDVIYQPGVLSVKAYRNGRKWAEQTVRTVGEAAGLTVVPDRSAIKADGLDLAFVTVRVIDRDGLNAPRAKNELVFSLEGPGEIVATDNGDPTSFESFQSKNRRAFNGCCLVIVRGIAGVTGDICITASGNGLVAGSTVVITTSP